MRHRMPKLNFTPSLMSITMERERFPLSRGLAIQAEQLAQWNKILKHIMYKRLHKWVMKSNSILEEDKHYGVHVLRGTTLESFIQNNLLLENDFHNEN